MVDVRALDVGLTPAEVLRLARDRPGLVGLVGEWCGGGALVAWDPVEVLDPDADPFEAVVVRTAEQDVEPLAFGGGWIGWWGYQLGRRVERLPEPPPRPAPQPDHHLGRYGWVLRQPSGETGWRFESVLPREEADRAFDGVRALLDGGPSEPRPYRFGPFSMRPSPHGHVQAVRGAIAHIDAGDAFQVNVCARLDADFEGDPLEVFCTGVETLRPAYAAFLTTGDGAVASFSPELFLRRRGRRVDTAPIKGTAPLTEDPTALALSVKNRAENVMIVDLMRNDLGRVCVTGTVEVASLVRPVQRAGVWHLVSDVTGTLADEATDAELLRATFPPGSVTGAPKVRAMELVTELEATGREVYTGAIGYVSPIAGLETSVVIRTLEFRGGTAWLGVGGGVVTDSDPVGELEECLTKAGPVLAAVGATLDPDVRDQVSAHPHRRAARAEPKPLPALAVAPGTVADPAAGLFDTVLVLDGRPVDEDRHLQRLADSVAALEDRRLDHAHLRALLREAAAGERLARVRLDVVPGSEPTVRSTRLESRPTASWRLVPARVPGGMGAHKWRDRGVLEALAGGETTWTDTVDPLLVDGDGTVLECGRGNVFVVLDDAVHTPPLDGRVLPGVVREQVVELLRRQGLPVHETPVRLHDLASATELFVTNAVGGVRSVGQVDGIGTFRPGPTTAWVRQVVEDRWHGRTSRQPSTRTHASGRPHGQPHVLLVDNYDSFTYNLAQGLQRLGARTTVERNDTFAVEEAVAACAAGELTHVVISPGPGRPEDAGVSVELVRALAGRVPVLGVCLGHQAIGEAYGARVVRAPSVVHGKPSIVHHDGRGVFADLDGPLVAGRYHSLLVTALPPVLVPTAHTGDGVLMGIRHRDLPVEGVQVHPESVLTPRWKPLLRAFLR